VRKGESGRVNLRVGERKSVKNRINESAIE
jgi:hypothetical protein